MHCPVSQLEKRYGIVRSGVYSRLKKLGITPQRDGRKAVLTEEQLAQMDALHQFLQEGGTIAQFAKEHPPQVAVGEVLAPFRALEEVCAKGWVLGRSQLAALLAVSESALDLDLASFADGGFYFRRAGDRLNGEPAWKVSKAS